MCRKRSIAENLLFFSPKSSKQTAIKRKNTLMHLQPTSNSNLSLRFHNIVKIVGNNPEFTGNTEGSHVVREGFAAVIGSDGSSTLESSIARHILKPGQLQPASGWGVSFGSLLRITVTPPVLCRLS
ncbi:hypothetical protein WA026_010559 [Henosepilachna vigintioctopunctata]|uniref:Uncharacterized protein n=1 Tax=Henosepilachna vigintioctopunctata TaxID=420089 RepID=A0AAW1VDK8_9CUCU